MFPARHDTEDLARHGGLGTTFFFGTERKDPAWHGNPAILINIRHIWECRSRKVNMEEINLEFFAGNFWLVISRTI